MNYAKANSTSPRRFPSFWIRKIYAMPRFVSLLTLCCVVVLLAPAGLVSARSMQIKLIARAGAHDRKETPVSVLILLPNFFKDHATTTLVYGTKSLVGQLTAPALTSPAETNENADAQHVPRQLHFILPELKADESLALSAEFSDTNQLSASAENAGFRWVSAGDHDDLLLGQRPVLQYMRAPLDESSPKSREQTYKVFHHVFDPHGKQLLTKGPGGQYTHHRGLFFGFNKVTYGDGKKHADVWHCTGQAYQSHEKLLVAEAGPLLGRQLLEIGWHGQEGETFAAEQRELTAFNLPGGTLIEFASRVTTTGGPIKLDGDPQHAGFHFRAAQEVAEKTNKQTYYVRPDGTGKPGETRNWPDSQDQVDLPWEAMSFMVGGQRYTAAYLDKPSNPKQSRFSERDYGRFGSYFEYEVAPEHPLSVNYRVWVQEGEMSAEQIARLAADFVDPVKVEIAK